MDKVYIHLTLILAMIAVVRMTEKVTYTSDILERTERITRKISNLIQGITVIISIGNLIQNILACMMMYATRNHIHTVKISQMFVEHRTKMMAC
jgi:hypothetical protein